MAGGLAAIAVIAAFFLSAREQEEEVADKEVADQRAEATDIQGCN